ncbi:hypothetical protein [Pseudomonas lijiangensis]|uniref:Uncharacterized protein n=1 Tax=Pseudomonas lijiangensis TaxID=2995658 RepID=A0ABX8HNI3_9PSED|nr:MULTISPECIES: hypothetical protein [Pseudomonas syringae group]MBX8499815.1 hypothetical protein [Pseudomonas lijiangensis]MBX8503932.1 hypothetical protein [Pseudomonas lijiangensis]MBX8566004.1 hypothetical protein [Pseudomonas cichorii]QWU81687.1 hypothetical protein KQP88_16680 [Pseudomonas lijiangensis]
MSFFSRVKSLFKRTPDEQVLGYSVSELKSVFGKVLTEEVGEPSYYPTHTLLASAGIQAYYSSFVMDKADVGALQELIDERFLKIDERVFNELIVTRYKNQVASDELIFSVSYKEFNVATIRLVTNSAELLRLIKEKKFAVPPPWIAFENYDPSWWGGDMQGAQGYYSDNYFFPFFSALSVAERVGYYARYSATDEWIKSLDLMLDI